MAKMTGFKIYKGTKETFISQGYDTTVDADAIVFITGGDSQASCIYTQKTYFGSLSDFLKKTNYVKGVHVDNKSYNVASGGGYIAFEASDPTTVSINVESTGISIGLTEAAKKSLQKAEAAAPQDTTYTKTEVDQMFTWKTF